MLNRIVNITAGSDFKNAPKKTQSQRYERGNFYQIFEGHDSISISPAYNFLTRHKWKIKELNAEDEKLYIDFILGDFEFAASINLGQINQISTIEYTVIKEKEIDNLINKIAVTFIVNLSKIDYSEADYHYSLTNIDAFFNRIMYLKLRGDLTVSDRKAIDGLLDGLGRAIQADFDLINNGLFIFISKYFNIKTSGSGGGIFNSDSVIVTKIRPIT